MGEGAARNQKCPCGSGKKYKHCHRGRAAQTPLPFNDILKQQRRAFAKRYCLLRASGECRGDVVAAHSVPRSRLRTITRDGKLYVPEYGLPAMMRNAGGMSVSLKGASQATTFSGFCAHHDKFVFASLEDAPFSGSAEQAFLLYFRTLAREVYAKRAQATSTDFLRELDRGRTVAEQIHLQTFATDLTTGIGMALDDMNRLWAEAKPALAAKEEQRYCSALFYFDRRPRVAFCGAFFPEFDFAGKVVQSLGEKGLDLLSVTMMPLDPSRDGEHGVAAFVWREGNARIEGFVDSLSALPRDDQAEAIVRLAFEHVENVALDPEWWEALTTDQQQRLIGRMSAGVLSDRRADCLADDGLRVCSWAATREVRSRPAQRIVTSSGLPLPRDISPCPATGSIDSNDKRPSQRPRSGG